MLNTLSQETINQYATDAQAIDEPRGTDWTQGVSVGRTVPAKWWNWLFSAVTKRANQAKADSQNMLDELKGVLSAASITPDPTDNTQLAQAVNVEGQVGITQYVNDKKGFFSKWTTEAVRGIRTFQGSDTVTIERLEVFPGSDGNAFYLQLKQHTSDPVADYWWHYTSTDLLNWHEIAAPNGAELQTADIRYFNGKYYFLYSVKDVHNAQLYSSTDAASWNFERSFSEYGVLALREAAGVLWMISASSQTYADISYHSYRTPDGIAWTDAGAIFRNAATVADDISPVTQFGSYYILGNKKTNDGLTWATIVTDWSNSAHSTVLFNADGGAVIQFNTAEGAWYVLSTPTGSPVKYTGTWEIKLGDSEGNILAEDTANHAAGLTTDGVIFTGLGFDYPSAADTQFFKCNGEYIFGKKKSADLSTWTDIVFPAGVTASPQPAGIGYYLIADTYFTNDNGANWQQGEAAGLPFCAVPIHIDSIGTCMTVNINDGIVSRLMTFNGVNRVIGTTLYLK